MLYMVIERFKESAAPEIYRRLRDKGRMMPEGVNYHSSWIADDLKTCWQVMETDDFALFDRLPPSSVIEVMIAPSPMTIPITDKKSTS
jgi:hypothetical protein